ncbi:FAD:protein FMN transferase [Marinilabiliaceae bacterium ANBcel2]|nr:FAD:protein FMN transferase [Marinilabiliaceae bacterium ANBcel2]
MNRFFSFILILLYVFIISSCTDKDAQYVTNEGRVFNTSYRIVYYHHQNLHDEIRALFEVFNNSLSPYESSSIISRVNNNEVGVEVDTLFKNVFSRSKQISSITDGAFDITVAPLVNAWGFGFETHEDFDEHKIDSLLQYVGMDQISIKDDFVVKEFDGVKIDGSAIAKGYAVDVVASFLNGRGISNFMIEIGGEIVARGVNSRGIPWRIGIDRPDYDPSALNRDIKMIIELSDKALATSGNYRNFYVKDGKKFAHTIDPRTGYPVEHTLLSASVVTHDAMSADAFATAFMVMGVDASLALTESLDCVEASFIYSYNGEQKVLLSSGFEDYVITIE